VQIVQAAAEAVFVVIYQCALNHIIKKPSNLKLLGHFKLYALSTNPDLKHLEQTIIFLGEPSTLALTALRFGL
jgi:hypothetical protein